MINQTVLVGLAAIVLSVLGIIWWIRRGGRVDRTSYKDVVPADAAPRTAYNSRRTRCHASHKLQSNHEPMAGGPCKPDKTRRARLASRSKGRRGSWGPRAGREQAHGTGYQKRTRANRGQGQSRERPAKDQVMTLHAYQCTLAPVGARLRRSLRPAVGLAVTFNVSMRYARHCGCHPTANLELGK